MAAKKKTDMGVFDRMLSGNGSEQLPGQMGIEDVTGASAMTAAEPAKQNDKQQDKKQDKKPEKKLLAFRADPDLIRRAKIYAVNNGVTLERMCVDALESKMLLSKDNLTNWEGSGDSKERTVKLKMTDKAQSFLSWYAKQGGITEAEQLRQLLDIKIKEEYARWEEDYKEDLRRAGK